ncbi:cofactor assembly of complex C subunit B [Brasilonema bromeliae]|uniref:Cofactor assembly of complex C subunit B n=1 Tax=Brasilonema bromeliae SPC951 TaxID=385972 RepID=A0ABX1P1P8_9CYAN|nr:cofactor assembly of complex C subunit B [Brasilonema bromeliae]NMG18234.1 cofactor assembly of complex C subunit B [Brasilonema bromeliae SPC951]
MDTATLPSTLLLTFLLSVGLFFFIRASTKDRTQTTQLVCEQDEATLMPQLREYFQTRSYRVAAVDPKQNQVTFEGIVRPSWFLAVFLTLLAAVGLLCLSLVLSLLFPNLSTVFLGLVLVSPLSGVFYWKKAGKHELVSLKVEAAESDQHSPTQITLTAHRDEITELRRTLGLKSCE